ncbi:MAG TPA: SDR family oxidoreductase, partial [Pirellulaceae bacterium]|nr:SDR family oxidoreductase [Pirellulaceae bacterium]
AAFGSGSYHRKKHTLAPQVPSAEIAKPMPNPAEKADSAAPLAGQVAVVTGASGGIGRAICRELAAAGADIVVHGRRSEAADEAAAEVRAAGRQAQVILADLADTHTLDDLVRQAWEWKGGISIWINAAGVDVLTGESADWTFEKKLDALWQVDVRATMILSRLAGARMKAAGNGAIVNIGWDQAEQGMAGDSGELFAAVKGAVMAFTRSLAQSLAPQVRVNCLAPGWIRTSWGQAASPYWQDRACRESLRGRWGTPEDVARAALFLASPQADFIAGQTLCVNGGIRFGQGGERQP